MTSEFRNWFRAAKKQGAVLTSETDARMGWMAGQDALRGELCPECRIELWRQCHICGRVWPDGEPITIKEEKK